MTARCAGHLRKRHQLTCHSSASLLEVCTTFEGMPCSFSAGRVAKR